MAARAPGKVLFFGSAPECDVRLNRASAKWPSRLTLSITSDGNSLDVKTSLLGTHWVPSVLAALTAAKLCGIALVEAAETVRGVQPFRARMQPVTLPSGAVMIRDEFNGSVDSFNAAMEVLRNAEAQRRLLVISDCSDFKKKPRERMFYFAKLAAECADGAVFIGDRSERAAGRAVALGLRPENVRAFYDLKTAADFLRAELRHGDLVLLRGQAREHLSRLYFTQLGTVECWLPSCNRRQPCDTCPKLGFIQEGEQADH
jgi:UDP-N-acetylmuramoyl-tripeptide--D-alanyl-D-alanine ligase